MPKLTPQVRKAIYVLATALLAVLAVYGLVTKEQADAIDTAVKAALALVTAMAAAHTPTRR